MKITTETNPVGTRPSSYQELLDADSREVPPVLRQRSDRLLGTREIPIDRYIDRAWHDRERQLLWPRVWQFACREEHVAEVGDHTVYDIAGRSYLIIRTEAGIKAYPNACLHRGRQLKQYPGRCSEIRCSFHGFAWHLDGRLKHIPAAAEFPEVAPGGEQMRLPEVRVGTWAGFVFINPDPQAPPLEGFLGDLDRHFARYDLAARYVEAHVAKVVRANWKLAQEAFMESFHVNATHPQTLPYAGDLLTQVDTWDSYSRMITPSEVPSPLLEESPSQDEMLRATFDVRLGEPSPLSVGPGEDARGIVVAATRERWRALIGERIDEWSDTELVDNFVFTVFPNFHPWGGVHKIVYRFRPNGDDHRSSIMETLLLSPFVGERPQPAPVHWLGEDEPWSRATELGLLGKIFDQDMFNMERVQLGLESTVKRTVKLSLTQENKIRWHHSLLELWMEED